MYAGVWAFNFYFSLLVLLFTSPAQSFFFLFHLELSYVSSYNSVSSVAPPYSALYLFFAIQNKNKNGSTYIAEINIISAALENSILFMAFAKRKKKKT